MNRTFIGPVERNNKRACRVVPITAMTDDKDLVDLEGSLFDLLMQDSSIDLLEKTAFMQKSVFYGLPDLNTGYDSPLISHFDANAFSQVIERCELLGVRIIGVEVFSNRIELLDVEISPEDGYEWVRRLVHLYRNNADVSFSATYDVPNDALNSSTEHG